MRFHNITKDDMLNGDGLRTVLWLSGCTHACLGCHNPITWDLKGGIPFDTNAKKELFETLKPDYIDGITLSGGELFSFDEESAYLESCGVTDSYIDRVVDENGMIMGNSSIMKDKMVYYEKRNSGIYTMYVNVKDLGNVDRGLLEELFYYLKPVNGIVVLEKAAT